MSSLLTLQQQQAIKPISANNETKFTQISKEVEEFELSKLLGYAFYQAVVSAPEDYKDLLDGCQFTDKDNNTVSHKGVRYLLAYLNFAVYVQESFVSDTFTGMVQKVRPDSEPVSQGTIKNLQTRNREIGFAAFELTKQYIELNSEKYPMWSKLKSNKRTFTPKFYGIKKTFR